MIGRDPANRNGASRERGPVRGGGLAMVLAGLLVTAACAASGDAVPVSSSSPPDHQPARTPDAVLVLGDSIAVAAEADGDLDGRLRRAGHRVEVVAEVGRTTTWGLRQVTDRPVVPPVAVVVLGSNPGPALDDFADDAERLVDALVARGAQQVVWVPPTTLGGQHYGEHAAALRQLATTEPVLDVVAWRGLAAARPQWFRGDRLHLTEEGSAALAEAIVAAVSGARLGAG